MSGVFHQSAKAHFHINKLTFDHPKWVFDLGPCLGFEVLDFALGFVQHAAFAQLGIGAASRGDDLPNHFTVFMLFALLDTGVISARLLESIHRFFIRGLILALVDSDYENHNLLINHLVDRAITDTAQFDFVAVGEVA